VCWLCRSKKTVAVSRSSTVLPRREHRQNFVDRNLPSEHRSRLAQRLSSHNTAAVSVMQPKLVIPRVAKYRAPGRPHHRFSLHQPVLHQLSCDASAAGSSNSAASSCSETAEENTDENVEVEDTRDSADVTRGSESGSRRGEDFKHRQLEQTLIAAESWTASGMVVSTARRPASVNHTFAKSDAVRSAAGRQLKVGFGWSSGAVTDGANMSCSSSGKLPVSGIVETDHCYAKSALTTPERLRVSGRCDAYQALNDETLDSHVEIWGLADEIGGLADATQGSHDESRGLADESRGSPDKTCGDATRGTCAETCGLAGDVLARLTVLNRRHSLPVCRGRLTRSSYDNCSATTAFGTPPQRRTVTPNKLMDEMFAELSSKIGLQLTEDLAQSQPYEQRSFIDKQHSAVMEDDNRHGAEPSSVVDSVGNERLIASAASEMADVTDSSAVGPATRSTGWHESPEGCCGNGWDVMTRSSDSGLQLLASVSSLTDDRLSEDPQILRSDDMLTRGSADETQGLADYISGLVSDTRGSSDGSTDGLLARESDVVGRRSTECPRVGRVRVFCLRKRCMPGVVSLDDGATRLRLLAVVRDFVVKGSSTPQCSRLVWKTSPATTLCQ